MKKSRLNLFKSTSMLISVAGIIMVVSTVIIIGYIGFSVTSSQITNEISSGSQYDELANLTSSYYSLEAKFDSVKDSYDGNDAEYNDARLELSRAKTAIDNVKSALDSGKPSSEVDSRLNYAKEKLQSANNAFDRL